MTELAALGGDTIARLWLWWSALALGAKVGIGGGLGVVGLVLFWLVTGKLARRARKGRQRVLVVVACVSVVLTLLLGAWAYLLPEPERVSFVLTDQIVRVGAALFGTISILVVMVLSLPWALDRLERQGFVNFVAARHVRADKSGFLTVISILSIAGVFISSLALCAVVSIMGGFGADLKNKILGNNAHISIDGMGAEVSGNGTPPAGDDGERAAGADAPHAPLGNLPWDDLLDKVRLVPGVMAATPVVTGEAMASSQSNTAGVLIRGIEPTSIGSVIDLVKNIEVGKFDYLSEPGLISEMNEDEPIWIGRGGHRYLKGPRGREGVDTTKKGAKPGAKPTTELDPEVLDALRREEDELPAVVLGRELAKTLHVYVGDEITLVSPVGDLGPMGVLPRARKFRVAAVFYSGMYEYDSSHAYMTLPVAQAFLDRPGTISQIEVKVEREDRSTLIRDRLAETLADQGLRIRDWKEMNKGLFSALELEKIVTFIILSIAIVVGSFCIICTLLLMVTEKSKEIAILKATGASDVGILKVFMTEGLIIGGIGTVLGVVTGLVLCLGLLWFGVRLDPDVYYVDRLPINVDPIDYLVVAACSLGITIAATIYPAVAASRLRPVEGIRYE
ncbi:MAG TPA: ABC transporter permease [Polyangiaceae bacterium]|nr:ABC transporter permease [Polyangiaceae bacterium]